MSKDYRFRKDEYEDAEGLDANHRDWVLGKQSKAAGNLKGEASKSYEQAEQRKKASKNLSKIRAQQNDLH